MIDRDNSVVGSSELYVTCSACNTRSKCVKIINYHPSAIYWLGPHSNCPKFPHHPKYDVDAIFNNRPLRGNTHKIGSLKYLDKAHLDLQQEIERLARLDG